MMAPTPYAFLNGNIKCLDEKSHRRDLYPLFTWPQRIAIIPTETSLLLFVLNINPAPDGLSDRLAVSANPMGLGVCVQSLFICSFCPLQDLRIIPLLALPLTPRGVLATHIPAQDKSIDLTENHDAG